MGCISITQLNDLDIIVKDIVEFDINKEEQYIELLNNHIKNGVFREDTNFYDNYWIIIIGGVEDRLILPNDLEIFKLSEVFGITAKEFNIAYRSFLLFNLYKAKTMVAFNDYIRFWIKKEEYNKTSPDFLDVMKLFIEYIKVPEQNSKLFEYIIYDDEYDDCNDYDEGYIHKKNKDTSKDDDETSNIPDFKDIFLVTDIINDIIENKNILDYKEYLLCIMWWKICSILPLRPSEFLRTKYDCIYEDEGKFYLMVRRSKGKLGEKIRNISQIDEYYNNDTVKIDSSLFYLIRNYQDILSKEFNYIENTELFPFEILKKYYSKFNNERFLNKNIIVPRDLNTIIKNFYNNVVQNEYNFDVKLKHVRKDKNIDYVDIPCAKDLRHIAIINLVLLGCDVYEVMNLAGHRSINTSFGYFNHVKQFAKGYALGYMKSIRNKEKLKKTDNKIPNIMNDELKRKQRIEDFKNTIDIVNGNKKILHRVDGGICYYSNIETDKSFCFACNGNHTLCDYFSPDNEDILINSLNRIEDKLDSNIRILRDLIEDVKGVSKFNELYQTVSAKLSKNIQDIAYLQNKILQGEKED